ncbi:MAG TPA: hypothetical protein ENH10_10460 [Bacteroidetes bacterium]|nr:hypothetical protein [Bacteroidota bacterium]HEX05554.1 hypothetical protein [Bacteroidota bacterium]
MPLRALPAGMITDWIRLSIHDIYVVDYPTMNMPLLPPQVIAGLIRKLQGTCLISQDSGLS